MRCRIRRPSALLVAIGPLVLCALTGERAQGQQEPITQFRVSFPASVHGEPITGRVFVMIAPYRETEPRLQMGRLGVPFFGHDVERLGPGDAGVIDQDDIGSPTYSLRDLPAGEYYVQGMVNIYSEFRRADGHVLWMHDDQWEGQHFNISPGNLYSDVRRVRLDPAQGFDVELVTSNVIPPIEVPPDDQWVKRFKFESPMLTRFWGRPIYLGATVLLPKDYDQTDFRYPVLYKQGHFSLAAPYREWEIGGDFYNEWIKDDFPRFIVVTFQHPTPYFDDSYAVNSVNVGPYGDAIMQELVPEVERRFRVITEPWGRVLDGGSTGGWESLALQVFHPDDFGGTWSYCPDPVTFTNVEGINIYEDVNAYYKQHKWYRVPTVNSQETDGAIRQTSEQRNYFELAQGTKGRSGQQLDIWSAVYGPIGEDGYFKPMWDKVTGEIDPSVSSYWRENYDILEYMKRNWSWLGPKLIDKIHVYMGDMDTYRLEVATIQLDEWMRTTENPHYPGFFLYGDGKPHCWSGPETSAQRLRQMAQHIERHMPAGTPMPWWQKGKGAGR